MNGDRLSQLLERPELRPLLPVLYIAWADAHLADEERGRIRDLASALPDIGEDGQDVLALWLDPSTPPSATELSRIRGQVRTRVERRPGTLASISASLSNASVDSVHEAVAAYERQEGISGIGVSEEIFRAGGAPVDQTFMELPPSFDVKGVQRVLDGEYAQDWDKVRELLTSDTFEYVIGDEKEAYRAKVLDWMKAIADARLGANAMPISVGGRGDMPAFINTFAALAMFDLSLVVKFGVQFGLFGGSILFLGTERHHQEYLADVASLKLLGGFAMTESGHGSNVREVETTAVYDSSTQEFVINSPTHSARKEWIGNAARDGRMMTVFAQLETLGDSFGVHAFLVPIRDESGAPLPGIRIEDCGHKMGLNGVDNGRLYFDQVRIPRKNLLDRYGSVDPDGEYTSPIASDNKRFFTMLGTLVGGRISVAAASVTAAKKTLAIAIRYGALRRQFGASDGKEQRILDYPTHQLRLFPALARTYALHFAVDDLVSRYEARDEESIRDVETLAAGIKSVATWHGIHASQMARECCGGQGFLSENRISAVRKDIDVFATFEGDNTVLMGLLAKNSLSSYAKAFQKDLIVSVVKQLTARAREEILEANPVIVRKTDEDHLRDADFHRELLKLRARNLLVSAAQRIRRRIEDGIDPFTAFNDIQDHLFAYAEAEMDQHIIGCFAERVEAMDPGPERDALETLRQLDAVHTIYERSGWYLENGYFRSDKSRAIRKLRLKLLEEVRPNAIAYTDAFGIPDECLSAPIAFENYLERDPLGTA